MDGMLQMATKLNGGSGVEPRCERERPRNSTDPYTVVVKKDGITVGKSMQ